MLFNVIIYYIFNKFYHNYYSNKFQGCSALFSNYQILPNKFYSKKTMQAQAINLILFI